MWPRPLTRRVVFGCGLVVWLAGASAVADDLHYNDYPIGNRAIGLGGAYTALSNDPSGLYYNPAGLVGATRTNVSVSTSLYGIESTSPRGLVGVDFANISLNIIPSEVGGSYAIGPTKPGERVRAAWGFEVAVPSSRASTYQRHEVLPDGFSDDSRTLTDQTLWAGIGAGFLVNDHLSLGASLFLQHRSSLLNERTTGQSAAGGFADVTSTLDAFDDSIMSILGAQYRLNDSWYFGASLLSPNVRIRSGGRAEVKMIHWGGPGSDQPSQKDFVADTKADGNAMSVQTHSAGGARLGVAYIYERYLTVSFDVSGFLPTSYQRLQFADPTIANALPLPQKIKRDGVVNFAIGAEWKFLENLSIAGGLFTDESSSPELHPDARGALGPSGRDALSRVNLYGGSIALGYLGDHSLTRVGFSAVTGWGQNVQFEASDNTWTVQPTRETLAYVFIASTFRY